MWVVDKSPLVGCAEPLRRSQRGSRTGSASLTASRMSGGMWFLVMYSTTPLGVETEIATSTESFGIVGHFSTAVAISDNHSRTVLLITSPSAHAGPRCRGGR